MASSRWKRFAFFERHTLNLPSEVLQDLIPTGTSETSGRRLPSTSRSSSFPNINNNNNSSNNDSVSLVVTTAALPLTSKPPKISTIPKIDDEIKKQQQQKQPLDQQHQQDDTNAVSVMWSSLSACTNLNTDTMSGDNATAAATIRLPSQAQAFEEDSSSSNAGLSASAIDGLVLAFVTSKDTDFIHCFDITVRCNPPDTLEKDLEDLDGWRGYLSPLKGLSKLQPSNASIRSTEDRIISEHLEQDTIDGIVGIASCRGTTGHNPIFLACISKTNLIVCKDPHLFLSCRRPLAQPRKLEAPSYTLQTPWNATKDGNACAVDIVPGIVAVGTDKGAVLVFTYGGPRQLLRLYLTIPPPPTPGMAVVTCKISQAEDKASVFVAYQRLNTASSPRPNAGVCCYDMPLPTPTSQPVSAPSARHDLDGRHVASASLCDAATRSDGVHFTVARPDGLYSYSSTRKIGVSPIDGTKLAICVVPPPIATGKARILSTDEVGSRYALVASTDYKSRRDAVDIYDATNKLVAFHLLLSPGHKAVCAAGVTTPPNRSADGTLRGGRSSALVLTSGGSLVTLTEKKTAEKVSLLVQKNLFSAAIFVAYADQSYESAEITSLYRRHAEHLYRKGDYSGAIDQYIHTIGSLEPSHVIFRYLDAPKIPLLVKYLEELRSRELSTPVHNELLRTCYLKLNDPESAESIAAFTSRSMDTESLSTIVATAPKDALATICSLEAAQAADALAMHGAALARVLPRETAGLVIALCLGTYSPEKFSKASTAVLSETKKMLELAMDDNDKACEPYPVHIFSSAFMENPKMLRLILAHCNRNKCPLAPSLRRTLLELTLAEWNQAKRAGDTESEKLRRKEAVAALTDSHSREIGDYDALVIVQLAGFEEGELLLYERLQMSSMLLTRYSKDGSEKARRQMLAMCQSDPEILADVLGQFVDMVASKLQQQEKKTENSDEDSDDETEEILSDIQEALTLARRQGVLPPVRIARILAGEGTGQFSDFDGKKISRKPTVPLSVALDYVGAMLDESRTEISRLRSEVEEYNQLCNSMEKEVESLLRTSMSLPGAKVEDPQTNKDELPSRINVEEMYAKVRMSMEDGDKVEAESEPLREAFWREMDQSEDRFDTICRFFAKGVIQ